ncbi:MAG: magnesium transporter CorA family protein [Limnobacter sp.]|nr:magnesium transporter CorA family protein [Limnobacter sp.]
MRIWYHIVGSAIDRLEEEPTHVPEKGFLWLDCTLDEELAWVADIQKLAGITVDELHIEDLNNQFHPSHFDTGAGYTLLIIRALVNKPLFDSDNRLSLHTRPAFFLLADRVLVSCHARDSRTFQSAHEFIERYFSADGTPNHTGHIAPLFKLKKMPHSADELQIQIISGLVDRYLEIRQTISSELDRWQRDLLNPRKKFRNWNSLLSARNELTRLETLAEDQTDAVRDWMEFRVRSDKNETADHALLVRTKDTLEHLNRIATLARRLGNSTETAVQLHFSATSHKTNEIITVLTVMSAIFMPLTLITGLFGMNFDTMPLLKDPHGFWISIAIMSFTSLALVLLVLLMRSRTMTEGVELKNKKSERHKDTANPSAHTPAHPSTQPPTHQ